jgi:predicted MPP superfamily phosphohydrolase
MFTMKLGPFIYFAVLFAALFLCPLLIDWLYRGYQNTKRLKLVEVRLESATATDEPRLHILQISDMHMEHLLISAAQLVRELEGKRIDLIALTGDFLDRARSLAKLETYMQELQKLHVRYGMFAVLGNHDYLLKPEAMADLHALFARYDVRLLQNESVTLEIEKRMLHVIGIDDFGTGHSDVARSFDGVGTGSRLVLTHDPNVVLHMEGYRFDYLLAGHFHGGQIHWPRPYHLLKMGRLARQNRVSGLHRQHGRPFYISDGLGQTGFNLRIGTLPELTLHQMPLSESNPPQQTAAGCDFSQIHAILEDRI